jgi:FkbM family methyltransferase
VVRRSGGRPHAEAGHDVDDLAGDRGLDFLRGQSPGVEAAPDQDFVAQDRHFNQRAFPVTDDFLPAKPSLAVDHDMDRAALDVWLRRSCPLGSGRRKSDTSADAGSLLLLIELSVSWVFLTETAMTLDEAIQAAIKHEELGSYVQALSLCHEILKVRPDEPRILQIFGRIARRAEAGTTRQALMRLQQAGFAPAEIIDVGAFVGRWSWHAKQIFPTARIFMVEAQARMSDKLDEVRRLWPADVDYAICLVGDRERGAVDFFQMETPYGSSGSSIYEEKTDLVRHRISLPMHTLDGLLRDRALGAPVLLKLDVQGAELDVLAGASRVLETTEIVIMEVSILEYNKGAPDFRRIIDTLADLGFVVLDLVEPSRGPRGQLEQADMVFVRTNSCFRPAGIFR